MNFNLYEKAKENIIVVAHRGASGGNIPCNTLAAYEIALKQGADMIEVDVNNTLEGNLVLFHPGMEIPHLNMPVYIPLTNTKSVHKLRYVNADNTPTQFHVASFDDFLEQFKGRCYINIDKFWDNPKRIYEAIKRHDMIDQVLVKSSVNAKVLKILEGLCPELPFMPIVKDVHKSHNELMGKNINYVGVECVFAKDTAPVAQDEFIEQMHKDGKLVWMNSIIYNYKDQICGGHSDDTALTVSEDDGWGWIADKNADFIQTDWTMMLIDYLKRTGKYYRNK